MKKLLLTIPTCLLLTACQTTGSENSNKQKGKLVDSGIASYYHEPQKTASGERYNPHARTAAHKSLPLGTEVIIVNKTNGSEARAKINDRGPYVRGRVIDTSLALAHELGFKHKGLTHVDVYTVQ